MKKRNFKSIKAFLKPTWAKVVIASLLPTFLLIIDKVFCLCDIVPPCICPPPYVYGLRPLPLAIPLYIKNEYGTDSTQLILSFVLGAILAYILACTIVSLYHRYTKKRP